MANLRVQRTSRESISSATGTSLKWVGRQILSARSVRMTVWATFLFCVVIRMIVVQGSGALARADEPSRPGSPAPVAARQIRTVDEELFVLHALQRLYDAWPADLANPGRLTAQLKYVAQVATDLKAVSEAKRFDSRITTACADCLTLVSAYEDHLVELGAIERATAAREAKDNGAVAHTAFRVGAGTSSAMQDSGYETSESVAGGIALGFLSGLFEGYERTQARNAESTAQIERSRRALDRRVSEVMSRTKVRVESLEGEKGWTPGEAGHDGFTAKKMGELMGHRPRDLFLLVRNAAIRTSDDTTSTLRADADSCLAAADAVPKGSTYEVFRADFLASAADIMVSCAVQELANTSYSAAPAPDAPQACRYCESYLKSPRADRNLGYGLLARARASNGELRAAIDAANMVEKAYWDAGYAFRYAKLMSMTGDAQKSLEWLRYALKLGLDVGVAHAKASPDFAVLREKLPKEFAETVKVKWSWQIDWGLRIANDSIVLKNDSDFALTNVVLVPSVTSAGYRDWKTTLRCDRIDPHSSYTWNVGVSGISSRGDDYKGNANLNCDQD